MHWGKLETVLRQRELALTDGATHEGKLCADKRQGLVA